MSANPDIDTSILITAGEMNCEPKFAASLAQGGNNNLFVAFFQNNKIKLKCSRKGGGFLSRPIDIMSIAGSLKLFKVAARGDVAVAIAIEDTGSGLKVKGVTGTISPDGPSGAKFTHRECPSRILKDITLSDILDLTIRINNDGTSDDYVFTKATAGANVSHIGHHPRAPTASPPGT